jgi:hypothetical protein
MCNPKGNKKSGERNINPSNAYRIMPMINAQLFPFLAKAPKIIKIPATRNSKTNAIVLIAR